MTSARRGAALAYAGGISNSRHQAMLKNDAALCNAHSHPANLIQVRLHRRRNLFMHTIRRRCKCHPPVKDGFTIDTIIGTGEEDLGKNSATFATNSRAPPSRPLILE